MGDSRAGAKGKVSESAIFSANACQKIKNCEASRGFFRSSAFSLSAAKDAFCA
jgi:hypothetical protein